MKKILFPAILLSSLIFAQQPQEVDPFKQMDEMFKMQLKQMQLMEKQMNEMFKAFEVNNINTATPMVLSNSSILSSGLKDKGSYYELEINVGKGNVKADVKAKDGVLTIKVDIKKEIEDKNGKYGIIKSYSSSSFMQSFTLPKDADSNKIDYEIKNGKLIVKIEKNKKR